MAGFTYIRRKFAGIAACLLAVPAAVSALEAAVGFGGIKQWFGMSPVTMIVPSPEVLRDSLAFTAHVKDFVPRVAELPQWRMADSIAVPTADYRNMGRIAPASAGTPFMHNPYAFDFARGGVLTQWNNGAVVGSSFRTTMPALMSLQNASVGVVQNAGSLTLTAGVSADRYLLWRGTRTAYSLSGAATYRFNDQWSATVFGRYSSNHGFYSMAAFPYMGTSGYGGFVTFMGETVGMDLGVERYYDTFARRWVTSPIITPKVRFSEKFTLELPVGPLVKEMIDNAVFNRKERSGPMIMPEGLPSVGEIPFGTPEMPK